MILASHRDAAEMGRPLERDDIPRMLSALQGGAFAPSEFSLANLWLFRDVHRYRLVEDAVPHVRGVTYDGVIHALPLVELTRADADWLFTTGAQCLYPYGEDGPSIAVRLGMYCSPVRSDSDYWYRGGDMMTLAGAKVRRAQARAFAAQAEPIFQPWTAALADAAEAILEGWSRDIRRPAGETDLIPCRDAIRNARDLGLEGGLVLGRGKPVAFLLASVRGGTRIVHFAKGRRAHSHAYPWMFSTYAAHSGASWLNFEQDLGIVGLAQSKRAYAPARIQPKFRLWKSLPI